MRLPFDEDQFLGVFAEYNGALWPGALLLWLAFLLGVYPDWALLLAGLLLLLHGTLRRSGRGLRASKTSGPKR